MRNLRGMLTRPGMYDHGRALEHRIRGQLQDLGFVDDRDDEVAREFAALKERGLLSALGMHGVLASAFGRAMSDDALAAHYAQVASALGYFLPSRRLSQPELAAADRGWAAGVTFAEVEARLGAPSFKTAGQSSDVLAYAGPGDAAWLYFYFHSARLICIGLPRYPFGENLIDLREPETGGPEETYREFLVASFSGDEAQIKPLIVSRLDSSTLWTTSYPADVGRMLASMFRDVAVVRAEPQEEIVYLAAPGAPTLAVVREDGGWKVDPEPLLRFRAGAKAANS